MMLQSLPQNMLIANQNTFNEEIKTLGILNEDLQEPEESAYDLAAPMFTNNLLLLDEEDLRQEDKLKKGILENILSGFGINPSEMTLIPADAFNFSVQTQSANQYTQSMKTTQNAMVYEASQEYYEKTNIEFSGKATIETPNGTYEIEINFEYTQEFYQRNTQEISYMQENLKTPMVINSNEFDDAFKALKEISLLFDILREESEEKNKNLFDYLKEMLVRNNIQNNKEDKSIDNFEVLQKNENSQYTLMAVQKEGIGIFVENLQTSSSSLSYSKNDEVQTMSSSYSASSMTSVSLRSEVFA